MDYNTLFSTEEENYKYAQITRVYNSGTQRTIDGILCNDWTVEYTQYMVTIESTPVITHTVHFVTNGGTSVEDQQVEDGGHATRPSTSRDGWHGCDWYKEPELINIISFNTYEITEETTLYAGWYQGLVIDTDGNGKVGPEGLGAIYTDPIGTFVLEGKTKNIYADPNENYEFFGWKRNDEETTFSTDNPLAVGTDNGEEVTFTALFKPVSTGTGFTVTFDLGGIGSPTPSEQHWNEPHLVIAPDGDGPTSDTHDFQYWYKDDANTPYEFGSVMESEDFVLHAKWEEKASVPPSEPTMWTVHFNLDESSTVIENQSIANNEYATRPIEIPEKEGWVFDDWYADSLFTAKFNFESTQIIGNTEIYAKYIEKVTITVDVNGGNPFSKTNYEGTKGQTLLEILGELVETEPTHPDGKVLVGITKIDKNNEEEAINLEGIEDFVVNENLTLRLEWANAITELNFTVTPPEVGSTTTTPHDGEDWDWDSQTNQAVITVPEGAHYWLDGNEEYHYMYWVEGFEGDDYETPFIGTFEEDQQYNMDVYIELDADYAITADCVITVNGEENGIVLGDYIIGISHYMTLGLNICTPPASDEVTVTIDINGGNPIEQNVYNGIKGQTLGEIIGDLPELTHSDESLMCAWFSTDPEGDDYIDEEDVVAVKINIEAVNTVGGILNLTSYIQNN